MDTAKQSALGADRPLFLISPEYSLVQLLALHRSEVVARGTIYGHRFDEAEDFFNQVV
ncbi:MAG: hypothetical protein ABSB42_21370 [Tepidisphaeraceae bacterium]|jgi:hypothetical protein